MSPALNPRPATRYHVVVTEIHDQGSDIAFDHIGDAYIAAVAIREGNRITGDVDHDGDKHLRRRLVNYINDVATRI